MQEVIYDLRVVAVIEYLVCEALHAGRGEIGEIVYEHAAPLKFFYVLGSHINSHHVDHEQISQASRFLCFPDKVPGKELGGMEPLPRPHVGEGRWVLKQDPSL